MNEFEKRFESLKSNTTTRPTTYCEGENDREGLTYEITDKDFEWLMCELVCLKQKEIKANQTIESLHRIISGMVEDAERIKRYTMTIEKALDDKGEKEIKQLLEIINYSILGSL